MPSNFKIGHVPIRIPPGIASRIQQRCQFVIFSHAQQLTTHNLEEGTMSAPSLMPFSRPLLYDQEMCQIRDHMRRNVISGIQGDVRNSKNIGVNPVHWKNHGFIRYLDRILAVILQSLVTEQITYHEWTTFQILEEDWIYTAPKAPSMFDIAMHQYVSNTDNIVVLDAASRGDLNRRFEAALSRINACALPTRLEETSDLSTRSTERKKTLRTNRDGVLRLLMAPKDMFRDISEDLETRKPLPHGHYSRNIRAPGLARVAAYQAHPPDDDSESTSVRLRIPAEHDDAEQKAQGSQSEHSSEQSASGTSAYAMRSSNILHAKRKTRGSVGQRLASGMLRQFKIQHWEKDNGTYGQKKNKLYTCDLLILVLVYRCFVQKGTRNHRSIWEHLGKSESKWTKEKKEGNYFWVQQRGQWWEWCRESQIWDAWSFVQTFSQRTIWHIGHEISSREDCKVLKPTYLIISIHRLITQTAMIHLPTSQEILIALKRESRRSHLIAGVRLQRKRLWAVQIKHWQLMKFTNGYPKLFPSTTSKTKLGNNALGRHYIAGSSSSVQNRRTQIALAPGLSIQVQDLATSTRVGRLARPRFNESPAPN